ncbi:MAG: hypothetical protein HRU12_20065 [Phaeodactylibacter sp.]|nr:hypothetical protein [Phaeodactylibacter sp.]
MQNKELLHAAADSCDGLIKVLEVYLDASSEALRETLKPAIRILAEEVADLAAIVQEEFTEEPDA